MSICHMTILMDALKIPAPGITEGSFVRSSCTEHPASEGGGSHFYLGFI